jgi:hypothetical protein
MNRHFVRAFPASLIFTSFLLVYLSVFSLNEKINLRAAESTGLLLPPNESLSLGPAKIKDFLPAVTDTPGHTNRPLPSYSDALVAKARMIWPSAEIPAEEALRKELFFIISGSEPTCSETDLFEGFRQMHAYGIFALKKRVSDQEQIVLRFATSPELHEIYAGLSLEIQRATGLDPHIIAHLIQKESGGDESAVSRAGATGLTQTLPLVIRELLSEKKKAGSAAVIRQRIRTLTQKISAIEHRHTARHHAHVYEKKKLEALLLIPDFTLAFSGHTSDTGAGETMERLALNHGALNICFGSAHLARYKAALEYYGAIKKIDAQTETLLGAQLAYNCGLSRLCKRIVSLGGWHQIFDIPPVIEGRRAPYLPGETAHYGYLFIKWYMAEKVRAGSYYRTHAEEAYHYKICLGALHRSRTFDHIVKTLDAKGMVRVSGALQSRLAWLLRRGDQGTLGARDISSFLEESRSLPDWPLVEEMRLFVETLLLNSKAAGMHT